jgi:hypothetical protein
MRQIDKSELRYKPPQGLHYSIILLFIFSFFFFIYLFIYFHFLADEIQTDGINETNPRVVDEARARKLASDLRRCSYYETCATYGLNIERVFQDGKSSTLIY